MCVEIFKVKTSYSCTRIGLFFILSCSNKLNLRLKVKRHKKILMKKDLGKRSMRKMILMLGGMLVLPSSCIDEYEADMASTDLDYLVVAGTICGNSTCTFTLSRSLSLGG